MQHCSQFNNLNEWEFSTFPHQIWQAVPLISSKDNYGELSKITVWAPHRNNSLCVKLVGGNVEIYLQFLYFFQIWGTWLKLFLMECPFTLLIQYYGHRGPSDARSHGTNSICIDLYLSGNDDVIKWKHFPRYWPFVRGIHRSPVNSPHKGQWGGALMFSLICARMNDWVNREAGDLRRYRTHYDVIVMSVAVPVGLKKEMDCSIFVSWTHNPP